MITCLYFKTPCQIFNITFFSKMILNRILSVSRCISVADRRGISAYFGLINRCFADENATRFYCGAKKLMDQPSGKGITSTSKGLHSVKNPNICVAKAVMVEDVQMFRVVHGGVYIETIEEAGDIIVNKHCINESKNLNIPVVPVLVKIEKLNFIDTTKLGEILMAEGEVIYTAPHSLRVLVSLYAAPVSRSDRRLVAQSWLWYVLVNGNDRKELLPVQPLQFNDPALEREGKTEHEKNKADRQRRLEVKNEPNMDFNSSFVYKSHNIITQSSCGWKAFSRAGPILRWMDELTGYVAIHTLKIPCVTGLCDDISFFSMLLPGSFVTLSAQMVFTSSRTVDVQCFADVETISDGRVLRERAVEAFFTYVVILKGSKQDVTIPQIVPKTDSEKAIFERRLQFYQARKQSSKN